MRKILNLVLVILIVSTAKDSFSQQYLDLDMGLGHVRILKPLQRKIDGSSNYNGKWEKGIVKFKGKDPIIIDSLDYDIYRGSVLFRNNGETYFILDNSNIEYFIINDSKFVSYKDEKISSTIMQLMVDGYKMKLFRLFTCIIIEGRDGNGVDPGSNDKFKIISDYYVYNSSELLPFKESKKQIVKLMADKKPEVESFMKQNHIKVKKQEDLIKIFEFYNSI